MTDRDDIIRMARKANPKIEMGDFPEDIAQIFERFFHAAFNAGAAAEREACAAVCDTHWDDNGQHCANAIRARGKQ